MALRGEDFHALHVGLQSAFPSVSSLGEMVRMRLGKNLAEIASGNLSEQVFQLITWAESRGQIEAVVRGALQANPSNSELIDAARRLGVALPGPSAATAGTSADLVRVRTVLCRLYDQASDISRVVADAGLDKSSIAFGGPVVNIWHDVLRVASLHRKVEEILAVARRDYPGNAELSALSAPSVAPVGPVDQGRRETDEPAADLIIGIITMTNGERDAVLKQMAPYKRERPKKGETRYYYRARKDIEGQNVDIICVQTTGQGNNSAGQAASDLVNKWGPDFVLLVGIAGGIHKEVAIGDVVVADQILYYEMAKLKAGERLLRTVAYQPAARLINAAKTIHGTDEDAWRVAAVVARPSESAAPRDPKVVHGPIGSGDKVVADADATELKQLRSINDKVLAVEMEAYGVATALHQKGQSDRLLVIRGISDHADVAKDDRFQPYAAHAAATYAFTLIRAI